MLWLLLAVGTQWDGFEGAVLSRWAKEEHCGGRCTLRVNKRERREGAQSLEMRFHLPSGWVIAVREFRPPLKISSRGALSVWLRNERPQRFTLLTVDLGFDARFSEKEGYLRWQRRLDWRGWKRLYLPLPDFRWAGRENASLFEHVGAIRFIVEVHGGTARGGVNLDDLRYFPHSLVPLGLEKIPPEAERRIRPEEPPTVREGVVDDFDFEPLAVWRKGGPASGRLALFEAEGLKGKALGLSFVLRPREHAWVAAMFERPVELGDDGALSLWVYNERPTKGLVLHVDYALDWGFRPELRYARWTFPLDWDGWRRISVSRRDFRGEAPDELWRRGRSLRLIVENFGKREVRGVLAVDNVEVRRRGATEERKVEGPRVRPARAGLVPADWLFSEPGWESVEWEEPRAEEILASLDELKPADRRAVPIAAAKGLFWVADEIEHKHTHRYRWLAGMCRNMARWMLSLSRNPSLDRKVYPFLAPPDFPRVYEKARPLDWGRALDRAIALAERWGRPPRGARVVNVFLVPRSHEDIGGFRGGGPGWYARLLKRALNLMERYPEFCWACEQGCLVYAY